MDINWKVIKCRFKWQLLWWKRAWKCWRTNYAVKNIHRGVDRTTVIVSLSNECMSAKHLMLQLTFWQKHRSRAVRRHVMLCSFSFLHFSICLDAIYYRAYFIANGQNFIFISKNICEGYVNWKRVISITMGGKKRINVPCGKLPWK